MDLERDKVASNQVYTKVSSTDDTCYLIYMKTRVTTLGLDNKHERESKYRMWYQPRDAHGCSTRERSLTTSNRSYTILGGSEMEKVSIR